MRRKSFEDWLKDVDSAVQQALGLSYKDLPDQPYRDFYEDGMSAKSVARQVCKSSEE